MPKAERGTPKDLANRMKAKGLQKLKFYCQMCNKQCRDENGFKCHLTSESHLRQMKIFAENAGGFLDSFSRDFEQAYLDTLRRRHGTKRMNANNVYQEVIQDKSHIHMNSTKWATLTDFVQYLGRTGKCMVEETERGWYVSFIERDPTLLARQEAHRRRVENERAEEEKMAKRMEKQRVEAAWAVDRAGGSVGVAEASRLEFLGRDQPVELVIGKMASIGSATGKKRKKAVACGKSVFDEEDDDEAEEKHAGEMSNESGRKSNLLASISEPSAPGALDSTMQSKKQKKSRWGKTWSSANDGQNNGKRLDKGVNDCDSADGKYVESAESDCVRKDYWLCRDIVVRIVSKKLVNGKFYRRKGVVNKIIDRFTGEVEILDSGPSERDGGDIVRIDQDDLETVVPKEGKEVRILNGRGKGRRAKVLDLDKKRYKATLKVLDDGKYLKNVDFDDFSKIA